MTVIAVTEIAVTVSPAAVSPAPVTVTLGPQDCADIAAVPSLQQQQDCLLGLKFLDIWPDRGQIHWPD